MHGPLFRGLLLVLLVLHTGILRAGSPHYRTGPPATWVKELPMNGARVADTACLQGGEEVLLLDRQFNLATQEVYWRRSTRLTSAEGVQNGSRIELDFDPSYQTITIHHLRIVRGGQVIDRMDPGQFRVLHREEDMSSYLYDGSLSVVVDLKDVRVGDIIDHAVTLTGWNPADEGRFHRSLYMAYSAPVARLHTRFVVPAGRQPVFKRAAFTDEPEVRTTALGTETVWDLGPVPCLHVDDGAPAWFEPYPTLEVSEFPTFEDLRAWALRQFNVDRAVRGALADRVAAIRALPDEAARIDSAVHLVQRELRYLGLEDGISAYRPHPPMKVFDQRFGDCKDKSLLLATMLQAAGIKAWPALVNTRTGPNLAGHLPRPGLFDHCITVVEHGSDTLWVDPTYTHNHGRGRDRYTPDYGLALVVAEGFSGLTRLQVNDTGIVEVVERIVLDTLGGGGDLVVTTTYGGRRADGTRADLAGQSIQEVSRNYTNYYAGIYGPCDMVEPLQVRDDPVANHITTVEHYRIRQAWDTTVDGRSLLFTAQAYTVRDHQASPGTADRTAPFGLGEPFRVHHRIELRLPSEWALEPGTVEHEGHGIAYRRVVERAGEREVVIDYTFSSTLRSVEASEARDLQDLQDRIGEGLAYEFSQVIDGDDAGTGDAWGKWIFLAFSAGVSLFGAMRLHRWDPLPHPDALGKQPQAIGSFLILPAIGIALSPLRLLWDMFSDDGAFFHAGDLTDHVATEHPVLVDLYMHGSQFFGFVQLAFTVVVAVLFFQRRTSVPLLMKVLYAGTLVWLCVDFWVYEALDFEAIVGEPYGAKEITRAFIAAAIWVPVFHLSERVRHTFTRQLDPLSAPVVMPPVEPPPPPAGNDH